MKKFVKTLVVSLFLVLSCAMSAFAEESQITFDLTAPGIQTQQMTLEDGTDVEIGCEYIPTIQTFGATKPWVAGTTRIWLTGPLSCEFKMDISADGKITNAYDETYTAVGVVVTGDSLSYSSSRATYSLSFETPIYPILGSKGYLRGEINGTNLVLSETIYGLNNFN